MTTYSLYQMKRGAIAVGLVPFLRAAVRRMAMPNREIMLVMTLCLGGALGAMPALALTLNWDGGGGADTNWATPANWDGDVLPGSGDTAQFQQDDTATFTAATGTQTINQLSMRSGGSGTPELTITGGTLNTSSWFIGAYGLTHTVNVQGGTLTASWTGGHHLGHNTTGILNVSSGSAITSGTLLIADPGSGTNPGSDGSLIVTGSGTFIANAIEGDHVNSGHRTVTVQDNGSISLSNLYLENGDNVADGDGYDAAAIVNVSDNAQLSVSGIFRFTADGAEDAINWTGGTISVSGTANIDEWGSSAFEVGGGIGDAELELGGNTHSFADGLVVASLGTLDAGTGSGIYDPDITGGTSGDLTFLNNSTLNLGLDSDTTDSDLWTVNSLDLSGSPTIFLEIDVFGTGEIESSDTFTFLDYSNLSGDFNDVTWRIIPGDNTRLKGGSVIDTGSSLQLTGLTAYGIPEPSTLLLFGLGAALLRRRIQRQLRMG